MTTNMTDVKTRCAKLLLLGGRPVRRPVRYMSPGTRTRDRAGRVFTAGYADTRGQR
jgi:hypothetical protein